jgi:fructose-1,6-bisphosphatase/inositol monophosphatase family enzyme
MNWPARSRHAATLLRIQAAFEAARVALRRYKPGAVSSAQKPGRGLVAEADSAVDAALRAKLLRPGEGWLSEEDCEDFAKQKAARVWVVDALDGTQEFVRGIPEYSISVAMVEDGVPVAAGICNPATQETFLGSLDGGVTYNGLAAGPSSRTTVEGAVVLSSPSDMHLGEWKRFSAAPFAIRPTGSIAYKLALVSALTGSGRPSRPPSGFDTDHKSEIINESSAGSARVRVAASASAGALRAAHPRCHPAPLRRSSPGDSRRRRASGHTRGPEGPPHRRSLRRLRREQSWQVREQLHRGALRDTRDAKWRSRITSDLTQSTPGSTRPQRPMPLA